MVDEIGKYREGLKRIKDIEKERVEAFQALSKLAFYKNKLAEKSKDIPFLDTSGLEEALARLSEIEGRLEILVEVVNSYAERINQEKAAYNKMDPLNL
jgi:hypothetical protein